MKKCKTCPGCKTTWTEKGMVKRIRQSNDEDSPNTQGNVASSSRSARRTAHSDTQNEDMPVLQPMVPSTSPKGKSSQRGKGKSKTPSPQVSPSKKAKVTVTPKSKAKSKGRGRRKQTKRLSSSEDEDEGEN